MSLHDRAAAAVLTQLAVAGDGTFLGIGIAYIAYRTFRKYRAMSSALQKIRLAAEVHPSDLRSILSGDKDDGHVSNSNYDGEKLVVVRGVVELKSAIEKGNWKGLKGTDLLISEVSGEKGVILEQSQTCMYSEWRGVFGWTADLRSRLLRASNEESSFMRRVPFVLVEAGNFSLSDFVVVNMDGSEHPLPLKTVYQHLHPISATPYTFFQAIFGLDYPIGLLYKEKILPLGKDITAVGICHLKDGNPEIKSCKDLPFFLSDYGKDQMLVNISLQSKVMMWGGVILGSIALGILCYSIPRNWIRWKEWRRRTRQQTNSTSAEAPAASSASDEESGDVGEGELCVICLMRRRRSAFVPCGHLVCCQNCAFAVERERTPKCPLCRQPIHASVRIYDS